MTIVVAVDGRVDAFEKSASIAQLFLALQAYEQLQTLLNHFTRTGGAVELHGFGQQFGIEADAQPC